MPRRHLWIIPAGLALAALAARNLTRLTRFVVAERSMEPALRPGDYLLARRRGDPPTRGEVVVFEHPARPGFELVKRVVGLPGETVRIVEGLVQVDGRPLAEPWARGPTEPEGTWHLGPGEVFVLGDQRPLSLDDGRALGPLPLGRDRWQVVLRYWPPGRTGRVGAG